MDPTAFTKSSWKKQKDVINKQSEKIMQNMSRGESGQNRESENISFFYKHIKF